MDTLWTAVLGLLVGGWFALNGFDVGLGMLPPLLGGDQVGRRLVLTALGPFFLANEVWLVATGGVLSGAFPALDGGLLAGFNPLVVGLLLAWLVRDAAVWFRSRRPSPRWRGTCDALVAAGSLALAAAAGLFVGNLAQGIPADGAPRVGEMFDRFALLCALTVTVLFVLHGAVFVALRVRGAPAERAGRLARLMLPSAAVLLAGAVVSGATTAPVRAAVDRPLPAVLVALGGLAALVGAGRLLGRRPGATLLCTGLAAAAPVLAVGAGLAPSLGEAVAADSTLSLVTRMALPVLPVVVGVQVLVWWAFRHRVERASRAFF